MKNFFDSNDNNDNKELPDEGELELTELLTDEELEQIAGGVGPKQDDPRSQL